MFNNANMTWWTHDDNMRCSSLMLSSPLPARACYKWWWHYIISLKWVVAQVTVHWLIYCTVITVATCYNLVYNLTHILTWLKWVLHFFTFESFLLKRILFLCSLPARHATQQFSLFCWKIQEPLKPWCKPADSGSRSQHNYSLLEIMKRTDTQC